MAKDQCRNTIRSTCFCRGRRRHCCESSNTSITVTSTGGSGNINFLDNIFADGGDVGVGGEGGPGGDSALAGAKAGNGGLAGNGNLGGKGGTIFVSTTVPGGKIYGKTASVSTAGGLSGDGGVGGNGGVAATGTCGNGGNGGIGSNGANGGNITVKATPGNVIGAATFNVNGAAVGNAGAGGTGGAAGGKNGTAGAPGTQKGNPGVLTVSYADSVIESDGAAHDSMKRKRNTAEQNDGSGESGTEFRPVAFVAPVMKLSTSVSSESHLIHSGKKDLIATIDGARIQIARGALVVIAAKPGEGFSVFCLHERKTGDVVIVNGGKRTVLHSSEQALVCHDANPDLPLQQRIFEPVALRNIRSENLNEGKMYLSQFSIPQAISHFQIGQQLKSAGKTRELASILKNAAVMQTAFANQGPYRIPDQ